MLVNVFVREGFLNDGELVSDRGGFAIGGGVTGEIGREYGSGVLIPVTVVKGACGE